MKNTFDYFDEMRITNHFDTIKEITYKILGKAPKWVIFLMNLRNHIVKIFGLETSMNNIPQADFKAGDSFGFFHVFEVKEEKVVLGLDDKHLNFRVEITKSLESSNNIKMSTTVHFNNRWGRLYFNLIKPFHKLISKKMALQAHCPNPLST